LLLLPVFILFLITSCSINFAAIQAQIPALGNKADGTDQGEYALAQTPVRVTLDVRLQNTETITERIIAAQSLGVDAVTGATGSSKAILKAVEAALQ
jgi:major membrane immunogen (membrane-anchored lipoprotein)